MNTTPENGHLRGLPAPSDTNGRYLPAPADVFRGQNFGPDQEPEAPAVPLSHYLWILRRHWLKILALVIISVVSTLFVTQRITPIYESTATVDIDRQLPPGIIGQDANRTALSDADQFIATQVKLIQSDAVLRPVADKYHLREPETQAATGNSVPYEDAPVVLKNLKVVRPPTTYLLLVSYRSPDPRLAANVANAVTRSYLEHTYTIRFDSASSLSAFMEKQLEELKAKMERSSLALAQFEKDLSVINPEEKTSILSSRLLQLNTEYTNAQLDRVRKETAIKSVNSGTLEAAQVSSQGESLKRLSERLDEARQKFADAQTHYGANHPEFRKAAAQVAEIERQLEQGKQSIMQRVAVEYNDSMNREATLKLAVAETKAEFDHLNARSFDYQSLKREAEGNRKLYEELMTRIKEAGINAGFQNSAIRIADTARPAVKPAFPNIRLNLGLALLFSLLAGIGAAVLSDVLDKTVRDPAEVARTLDTQVVGLLPVIKQKYAAIPAAAVGGAVPAQVNGNGNSLKVNGYDEAIRTLRNAILLADFDRRIRSLMVTSASPSEGKSTIATHLAIAHAQQGRNTLLIDGDLRRPSVHRQLGLTVTTGLSDALTGELPWSQVLVRLPGIPNLTVLPAGPPSRRASDLIGTDLIEILEDAAKEYDLIIVDSPPLLGFPEPLQMAASVDGVLMVARSGQTIRKALGSAITTLTRLRVNVVGIVLNEVRADSSEGYYYHYYSTKYYKHYNGTEAS